jgi:hypothetical protein
LVTLIGRNKKDLHTFDVTVTTRGPVFNATGRVTRLGDFSLFGQLFTLGCFLKLRKVAKIIGLLLPQYMLFITFDTMGWVGLHFGRFFLKLIWSP